MGPSPILSIIHTHYWHTAFLKGGNNAHGMKNVMCKQTFTIDVVKGKKPRKI